jgi:hypothetical protein
MGSHKVVKALLVLAFLVVTISVHRVKADDDPQTPTTTDPSTDDGSDDTEFCRSLPIKIQP